MKQFLKMTGFGVALVLALWAPRGVLAEVKELEPQQLQSFLRKHPGTQLVDVRETWERRRAKIPKSRHIPLQEMTSAKERLDMEKVVITYCKSGRRSRHAAEILEKIGFTEVYTLRGGINAYSSEVDSSIPTY